MNVGAEGSIANGSFVTVGASFSVVTAFTGSSHVEDISQEHVIRREIEQCSREWMFMERSG